MEAAAAALHAALRHAPPVQRFKEVLPLGLEHIKAGGIDRGGGGVDEGCDEEQGVVRAGYELSTTRNETKIHVKLETKKI